MASTPSPRSSTPNQKPTFASGQQVMVCLPFSEKRLAKVVNRHGSKPGLYYIRMWFDAQGRWAHGMRTIHERFLEKLNA